MLLSLRNFTPIVKGCRFFHWGWMIGKMRWTCMANQHTRVGIIITPNCWQTKRKKEWISLILQSKRVKPANDLPLKTLIRIDSNQAACRDVAFSATKDVWLNTTLWTSKYPMIGWEVSSKNRHVRSVVCLQKVKQGCHLLKTAAHACIRIKCHWDDSLMIKGNPVDTVSSALGPFWFHNPKTQPGRVGICGKSGGWLAEKRELGGSCNLTGACDPSAWDSRHRAGRAACGWLWSSTD